MIKKSPSYRDLEIFKLAMRLSVEVDEMTKKLPKHEFWEIGSQVRRSSKSIPSHITEGYGRKRYKKEYIKFLIYALSSCDETLVHLETLFKCGSLDQKRYNYFNSEYTKLGKMISNFLNAVIEGRAS